ncbi:hypothetical protein OsI_18563 [Oryza sativa Indica Group]|uniref:Uncharacterized protein n=1 Tax=Oryza sativa subsp. indica TaxID=39946 RepID=B8AYE6_ORYSI|nr:hypothetical protein OsI_18563 [Oryza sativa Indica Group]
MPPKRSGTMKATAAAAAGAAGTSGASPVGGGPAGDASAAAGRRVTRLRSRELGLEATAGAGEDVASDDPGPARKKGKVQPATKGAKAKAVRADPPAPPPRPRLPPFPKSGDPMDFLKWDKEFRRICALPEPAGTVIPCTVRRKPTGPRTVSVTGIASVADNSMIRKASRSVVGISSRIPGVEGISMTPTPGGMEKGQKATDFFSDSLFASAGRSGSGKGGCVGSREDQDGRIGGREVRDGGISSGGPKGNTGPSITVETEMEQPRQLKGRPPRLGRMREVSSVAGGIDFRRFHGCRECEKCRPWARLREESISGDSAAGGCDLRRENAISGERRRAADCGWGMCAVVGGYVVREE